MKKTLVLVVALSACSGQTAAPGGGTPAAIVPDASGKPLAATPATVDFALGGLISPPQTVRLKGSQPLSPGFQVSVADPTQVGVSAPKLTSARTAKVTFFPISIGRHGGQTTATIIDINTPLVSVNVPVTQQLCGRPENLAVANLIYPPIGTTASPRAGALYFAVYSAYSVKLSQVNLHLIVGKNGTLEGINAMGRATPPPGSVIPTPPPGPFKSTYMRGTIPKLPRGVTIRTQVYDDNCQPPVLAGAFKTK